MDQLKDQESHSQHQFGGGVSEDEHVVLLIQKEISLGFKKDGILMFDESLKSARLNAIKWIFKTTEALDFHFQTAYLSVTYLDQFLTKRYIDAEKNWAIRLLSIACLSLAAKMEECNVPELSNFQSEDCYFFQGKAVQKMELLVLTTLDWNMGIITPFSFLSYFVKKFSNDSPSNLIVSNTMQPIFTVIMEGFNLMDHKPSVVAAAATLLALNQTLTIEDVRLKMNSVSQTQIEPNDVFDCYKLIQRLYEEKIKRDEHLCTPNSSVIRSRTIDYAVSMSKRRRLSFINDEDGGDKKGPRQEDPKT